MKDRWRRLSSEIVHDAGIFQLRRDDYTHKGRPTHPFYVLETGTWINVVPITVEGEVVLVRQYRHGIREVTLEVPGGVVEESEEPSAAAARELLEETGYQGDPPVLIGNVSSNPAILNNRTHSYLVSNLRRVAEPSPDEHEDVEVERVPVGEIPGLIESGKIHHSLSVLALCLYLLRGGT